MGDTIGRISDPADVFGTRATKEGLAQSREFGGQTLALQKEFFDYIKEQFEPYSVAGREALATQQGLLPELLAGPDYEAARQSPQYQELERAARASQLAASEATGGLGSTTTQNALGANAASILQGLARQNYADDLSKFNVLGAISGKGLQGGQGLGQFGGQSISGISNTLSGLGTGALNAAAAQRQQGQGLLQAGIGALAAFSDIRLKDNVKATGEKTDKGHEIYTWTWNEKANSLGLYGNEKGVIADKVEDIDPGAVFIDKETGYKKVNYERV